jgi:hypothetical protein
METMQPRHGYRLSLALFSTVLFAPGLTAQSAAKGNDTAHPAQPVSSEAASNAAVTRLLFPTNPAPAYNGSEEYSLTVDVTRIDYSTKAHNYGPPIAEKTRVMEQLKGFVPQIVASDKWGGRLDDTEPATGFFYTRKVRDRWYAIDPEGHPYFHQALVELSPSKGPTGKVALQQLFGDKAKWMNKTHALLLQNGFNGAGAWSDAEAIRHSALQPTNPLAYTVNLDVMSSYGHHRGGMHVAVGNAGYLNNVIFVFDPAFATFADSYIQSKVAQYVDDPALFGYFSDNEMPIRRANLDGYLGLPKSEPGPTDELRYQFLTVEMERYASIVSAALKKYDPHHMYLGCRFTGDDEKRRTALSPRTGDIDWTFPALEAFAALGKYADAISVNYYGAWTPTSELMASWEKAAQKPLMITEWYVKGADSGMSNRTGAGWQVKTQAERGDFYQNYVLALIESKVVIGWHWFKYQDNDPDDPNAELSNKDSNKGIVNIQFQPYAALLERMKQLNPNAYALADYFDKRSKKS